MTISQVSYENTHPKTHEIIKCMTKYIMGALHTQFFTTLKSQCQDSYYTFFQFIQYVLQLIQLTRKLISFDCFQKHPKPNYAQLDQLDELILNLQDIYFNWIFELGSNPNLITHLKVENPANRTQGR